MSCPFVLIYVSYICFKNLFSCSITDLQVTNFPVLQAVSHQMSAKYSFHEFCFFFFVTGGGVCKLATVCFSIAMKALYCTKSQSTPHN